MLLALLALPVLAYAQYTPWYYWTFLPEEQMNLIVGEASGETAFATIMETGGYTRNRRPEEYNTTFKESAYIYDKLQWYGVPGAYLQRIPVERPVWNGIRGDLWEVSPGLTKIVSYRDNAFHLTEGSNSADVEAELVWVGSGSAGEIADVNVQGKIAVGHGNVRTIHNNAILQGAVGVVAISTSRNYVDPLQIPQGRIGNVRNPQTGETIEAGFAFQMNIREGQYLRSRLRRGETIVAHARVEVSFERNEIQNVEAHIPGRDPNATAVILSAHIFEGLMKQGANDNKSGGAAILEIARVLNTLIEEGKLPQPERGIRFVWGPEFAGTRPWVASRFDEIKGTFANINMDMVGEWLSLNQAYFCLMRTTFGNTHYINDVMENYYRYVGEGNRERIQNRGMVHKVPRRIVAPMGADEPFHYSIETHYGASDHVVFNDWGVRIPGIMMIAWPDLWYHTSGDVVDKADPTQLKRAVVIAAAAAYTIANADDAMALKIAGEIAGNSTRRLGHQLNIAMEMVNHTNSDNLADRYKAAVFLLEAHIANEKATLETVYEMASSRAAISDNIEALQKSVDDIGKAQLDALAAHMTARAGVLGIRPISVSLTSAERRAERIVPQLTPGSFKMGPNVLGGMMSAVDRSEMANFPITGRFDRTEAARLVNGTNSVLMIKKMLDAQSSGTTSLENVMNYMEQLRLAGVVTF